MHPIQSDILNSASQYHVTATFCHVGEMEASSSTVTANQGVKTATFYGWKYSHYFVVVEESDKNL